MTRKCAPGGAAFQAALRVTAPVGRSGPEGRAPRGGRCIAEELAHEGFQGSRRAFTLVEALVAILVVGVVMPVALAAVSQALRAADRAAGEAVARRLAAGLEARLHAANGWSGAASAGGFDPADDGADCAGYRWRIERADWRGSTLVQVRLTVLRDGSDTPLAVRTTLVPAGGG